MKRGPERNQLPPSSPPPPPPYISGIMQWTVMDGKEYEREDRMKKENSRMNFRKKESSKGGQIYTKGTQLTTYWIRFQKLS